VVRTWELYVHPLWYNRGIRKDDIFRESETNSMFSRLINLIKSWFGFGLDKLENPDILLDQAKREMHEMHSRNRERAVAAITQKNNLQSMVVELEKQIANLQAKAEFALKKGERDLAVQLLTEKQAIESSLGSTKEALEQAIQTSEQVKEHIKREEEMIRRKTAEALQLKAQWKSAQIQNEMEKALGAMGQFEQAETAFGRAKEKITQSHHESRARAELGKGRVESRLAGLEDIERSAAAEAELAELELKLGLSSAPLPQQTASAAPQTDVERQLAELEAKLGTGGSGSTTGTN